MKKITKLSLSSIGVLAAVLSASALAGPQHSNHSMVAPFTDNLQINASNFPAGGAVMEYQDNNGLHIYGPNSIAAGDSQPNMHIHADVWSSGDPEMTMVFPTTGEQCVFQLHDGALVQALNYTQGQPPQCSHLTISQITQNSQYGYTMNVSYN
jgi:hypothetical protein